MKQATGNAREQMQAALRHSRAARLRRRIGWCDRQLRDLRMIGANMTEEQARLGLQIRAQKDNLAMHLVKAESEAVQGGVS